jgi:hypothetical protein
MEIHKIPWFQSTNPMRSDELAWNILWYDADFMVSADPCLALA